MWTIIAQIFLALPSLVSNWLKARKIRKQSLRIEDQRTEIATYKGKEAKDEFIQNVESSDNRLKSVYGQLHKRRYPKKNNKYRA